MKRLIPLVLLFAFSVCVVAGCADNDTTGSPDAANQPTRTITDSLGRVVEIPAIVETLVPLGNTPRMITYLGLAEQAVGIGGMASANITPVTAYAYANKDLWADLPIVGTDAAGATDYYPEEIIKANPDLILCSYTKELADEIQTKTGIPVIAVPMGTLFGADYEEALRLLADVCGVQDRAEEVIAYINDCLRDLDSRTAQIADADKPSVLGAAATFKGVHGIEGVYSKYEVFAAIAANDVTDGIFAKAGGILIDKEQILGWNPQFIFLDSGGVNLVRQDYAANAAFYAQLSAVQTGNVYQYPSSTSYYTNVEIPIVNSYYVASLLYPEQFNDLVFADKADEIFRFFLGADNYLSQLEAAGAGYGQVVLGD